MICPNCGNENPDDNRYCAYCGAPADLRVDSAAAASQGVSPTGTVHDAYHNPYQSAPQGGDPYAQAGAAAGAGYAAASAPYEEMSGDVPSVGQWLLNIFLAGIPVIGLILMIVWSFSSGTPAAKKNWARANLIWSVIIFIIATIFATLMAFSEVATMSYMGGIFH